jgi:hypothetical protein
MFFAYVYSLLLFSEYCITTGTVNVTSIHPSIRLTLCLFSYMYTSTHNLYPLFIRSYSFIHWFISSAYIVVVFTANFFIICILCFIYNIGGKIIFVNLLRILLLSKSYLEEMFICLIDNLKNVYIELCKINYYM